MVGNFFVCNLTRAVRKEDFWCWTILWNKKRSGKLTDWPQKRKRKFVFVFEFGPHHLIKYLFLVAPGVRQNSNFQILGCLKENWPSIMRPPLIMQIKFSFIFKRTTTTTKKQRNFAFFVRSIYLIHVCLLIVN